jgi:hypothetical protein
MAEAVLNFGDVRTVLVNVGCGWRLKSVGTGAALCKNKPLA